MDTSLTLDLQFDDFLRLANSVNYATVDTESDPDTDEFLGISICFQGLQNGVYFPIESQEIDKNLTEEQCQKLREYFASRDYLVFHNAAYDLKRLERKFGYRHTGKFYCTMLMIHWINEHANNYSLDAQSKAYGGKPKNRSEVMQQIIDQLGWRHVPVAMIGEYGANDAFITDELFQKILPEFVAQDFDGELWEYEQEFIWVVADMIELGIALDLEFCVREKLKGEQIMRDLRSELRFNPGSSVGLRNLLIAQLHLPVLKKTEKGSVSFDKKTMEQYDVLLEEMEDDRAGKVLRYRGWQKTVSSNYNAYIRLRDKNNILHPGYKLHGTETGRMSCADPNLQQIPKASKKEWNGDLKKAFVPRDGYGLWEFDYSQLEFRLTVAYAEQYDLIEIFNDPTRDIFQEMADAMGWTRNNVKTLVYLILFGGGANRARVAFGLETLDEAKEIVNQFHKMYPGIRKISNQAQRLAAHRHYVMYWSGRRRHFPPGSKYYRAFNSIIQGGEAEIVKRAMIRLAKSVCHPEECRMVLQVHDAIVFEIKEGFEDFYFPKIKEAMEAVDFDFGVKFPVDVKKWGEK